MARVVLSSALSRWIPSEAETAASERVLEVPGDDVRTVLEGVFARHPGLRGYVLDEHGALRHHVALFVDGDAIRDKRTLAQPLREQSELHVMQALSGG